MRLLGLNAHIVLLDGHGKLYLVKIGNTLIFLGFLKLFLHLEAIFAVVHDLAHRRYAFGSYQAQIHILALGNPYGLLCGHNAQLLALCRDYTDLFGCDLVVDVNFVDRYAPPKKICGQNPPAYNTPYQRH